MWKKEMTYQKGMSKLAKFRGRLGYVNIFQINVNKIKSNITTYLNKVSQINNSKLNKNLL